VTIAGPSSKNWCGQKHLKQELSTFAAHANGGSKSAEMPMCPGGRCTNPGMCGMN
jgi:hypothetical protein